MKARGDRGIPRHLPKAARETPLRCLCQECRSYPGTEIRRRLRPRLRSPVVKKQRYRGQAITPRWTIGDEARAGARPLDHPGIRQGHQRLPSSDGFGSAKNDDAALLCITGSTTTPWKQIGIMKDISMDDRLYIDVNEVHIQNIILIDYRMSDDSKKIMDALHMMKRIIKSCKFSAR